MQMVILAGGPGRRMRPLSSVVPNPLVRVDGRPFLAHQLDIVRANGIRRVVLCVGHLAGKVQGYFRDGSAFGIEIVYSDDGQHLLGTAGALRKARRLLDEAFFVMYGDTYTVVQYPRIWSYFQRFNRLGLVVLNHAGGADDLPVCTVRGGLVTRCAADAESRRLRALARTARGPDAPAVFLDTGLSVLRREALALVPPRRHTDLPTLFNTLAGRGQLLALRTDSLTHSIASQAGLSEFRHYLAALSA